MPPTSTSTLADFLGLVRILFGTMAYCDGNDYSGSSPALQLVVAARYGDLNNLKKLYNHRRVGGLDNSHPSDGVTPLIAASQQGHLHVVDYLVKRNVNVDTQDASGETALIKAVRSGKVEVIQYLLTEGKVNAKIRNYQGETALSIAVFYHQVTIVEVLLEKAAEPWNVRECNPKQRSESPLSLARDLKFKDIEATLLEYDRQQRQQKQHRNSGQSWVDEKVNETSPTFAKGTI